MSKPTIVRDEEPNPSLLGLLTQGHSPAARPWTTPTGDHVDLRAELLDAPDQLPDATAEGELSVAAEAVAWRNVHYRTALVPAVTGSIGWGERGYPL